MAVLRGVSWKLISDIEKHQFIESVIRAGISMICKGPSKASNKFLKSYNPSKPSTYIANLDANKLYRHSMVQVFSIGILDWLIQKILIETIILMMVEQLFP